MITKLGIGDRLVFNGLGYPHGEVYLVASPSLKHVVLINIKTGCRYGNAIPCEDTHSLTQTEIEKLAAGDIREFKKQEPEPA